MSEAQNKFKVANYLRSNLFLLLCAVFIVYGMFVADIIVRPHYSFSAQESADFNKIYLSGRIWRLDQALNAMHTHDFQAFAKIIDHSVSYYFYLALAAEITGSSSDAPLVFLGMQMKAAIFLLAIYPLMFFFITKSKAIAFLAPWLLDRCAAPLLYEMKTDTYWVFGWIIALGVPLLWFLWKRKWGIAEWCAFGLLNVCIALANLPRAHGALPIAACLIFLIILRMVYFRLRPEKSAETISLPKKSLFFLKHNKAMLAAFIIVIFSYPFFTGTVPAIMRTIPKAPHLTEGIEPWHAIYLGLGYIKDNPYGIRWLDQFAYNKVHAIDPTATKTPYSKEYMNILKREWFTILRENPQFILKTYSSKFFDCFTKLIPLKSTSYQPSWLSIVIYSFILILLFKNSKENTIKILKKYAIPLFICISAGLVAVIPCLIAIVAVGYGSGFISAYNILIMLALLMILHMIMEAVSSTKYDFMY